MRPYYDRGGVTLFCGDNRRVIPELGEIEFDAVITDPPYGLGFMGRDWDHDVPGPVFWKAMGTVMKPGAHLASFGGTRTQHRIAVAIEDAGFEIRDTAMWLYGCLSEDTEILADGRWLRYEELEEGMNALCYDQTSDTYEWMPIEEVMTYEYSDTAYRIQSDSTDQIVSRNHRCLVERSGEYVFEYAETLEREARVPVLEDMRALLESVSVPQQNSGSAKPVLPRLQAQEGGQKEANGRAGIGDSELRSLRERDTEAESLAEENQESNVFAELRWQDASGGASEAQPQREQGQKRCQCGVHAKEDDRAEQSILEGRRDIQAFAWEPQGGEVRTLPERAIDDGEERRLRDGAPACGCAGDRETVAENRGSAPRRPQPAEQRVGELDAVQLQQGPQIVRASRFTRADLATVEPIHYEGIVWCVRVPTGAFVARRSGKAFVTGNSGFPKGQDIGKMIDRAAGVSREVAGPGPYAGRRPSPFGGGTNGDLTYGDFNIVDDVETEPATEAAKQWSGWNTQLKPAYEPIIIARKKMDLPVHENVLKHGTGAMNIEATRVGTSKQVPGGTQDSDDYSEITYRGGWGRRDPSHSGMDPNIGRWPANVILDPVAADMVDEQSGVRPTGVGYMHASGTNRVYGAMGARTTAERSGNGGDTGGASRFFYVAKATRKERGELNLHPTVKPIALMRYLIRMFVPRGAIILDPFAGSGTTLIAAAMEGVQAVGIEKSPEYCAIIKSRLQSYREEIREARR